jgi:hypothetical protein
MAVIDEHKRPKYLRLLDRARVGVPLDPKDQFLVMEIYWPDFDREYGLKLINFYHGDPVTQEFIDALARDLGLGRQAEPEEDIWL